MSVTFLFLCSGHRPHHLSTCLPSPFSFVVIIIFLSLSHHSSFFTQNTRLVPKVSSPAWPLLSLSTAVLTPTRVGSPILSEGTLPERRRCSFFSKCSFNPIIRLYLCLRVQCPLVAFINLSFLVSLLTTASFLCFSFLTFISVIIRFAEHHHQTNHLTLLLFTYFTSPPSLLLVLSFSVCCLKEITLF